ncbi:glycosyltransferase family protein [Chitinophaga ginsengisoli]|uniref:Phosphatidylinositol glycan class B n=1 Tax=Chitinophaga ginsengisoli TaxID=363837 RepID=A0A2P8FRW5_9BACT|nr:hypothetical protein [Chitinophaga ginsengisoli]PSL24449.1 phosphatidylinositol glycan class B [Chitinophaga ginsengisoli]
MHLSLRPTPGITLLWPLAIIVYSLAAYFNMGYYHPDEHYQIIEFAGLKLGWNRPQDLAWEYDLAIRPTIQPWLCFVYFKLMLLIGIKDPYQLAFSLRLLTAACSLFVTGFFAKRTYAYFQFGHVSKTLYYYGCYFLWFIPMVSVRFSSETWSGLLFTLALALTLDDKATRGRYLAIGALLGACFLFRFQCGILAASLTMWMLIAKREAPSQILLLIAAIVVLVLAGVFLDYLFYHKLTLTFINYFQANIIEDTASKYGVASWSTLVSYILLHTIAPFGILIFASLLWLMVTQPKNPIPWCVAPFILIHAIIPHKEIRFLFPLVWIAPCMIFLMIEDLYSLYIKSYAKQYRLVINCTLVFLALTNVAAMAFSILKPAGTGQKYLTTYIDASVKKKPVVMYFSPGANPYQPWSFLPEHFYANKNVVCKSIEDISQFEVPDTRHDGHYLLAIRKYEKDKFEILLHHKKIALKLIKQSMPLFELPVLSQYVGFNSGAVILLYSL